MRLLWFGVLALCSAGGALAQERSLDALGWVHKIYAATEQLSYRGTFVYQHGSHTETSRIARLVEAGGAHERLEVLDGTPREIVRNQDEVACYLPGSMTVKIEKQGPQRPFPGVFIGQVKDLDQFYKVRKAEVARIAGYECQAIVLEPRDRLRYGHKLWADKATGMLVKAQTFNEKNEIIEQFVFTELRIGDEFDRSLLQSRFAASPDWRIERSEARDTRLADEGWVVSAAPPGYKKVSEMKRELGGVRDVTHLVLSDGLAAVSVFIEPAGARPQPMPPGASRQGAINVYTRQMDAYLITVVGEAPAESVRSIAYAVEHRKTN